MFLSFSARFDEFILLRKYFLVVDTRKVNEFGRIYRPVVEEREQTLRTCAAREQNMVVWRHTPCKCCQFLVETAKVSLVKHDRSEPKPSTFEK